MPGNGCQWQNYDSLSSSTCFLHVLFSLHFLLLPSTSCLMPFRKHVHSLSSTHDHTNEHCHSQLTYGFIKIHHKVLRSTFSTGDPRNIRVPQTVSKCFVRASEIIYCVNENSRIKYYKHYYYKYLTLLRLLLRLL